MTTVQDSIFGESVQCLTCLCVHILLRLCIIIAADPLKIIFTDQTRDIRIGTECHMTCVVSGGSNPTISWIFTNGNMPSNTHIENTGRTLVISNYRKSNDGSYICVASDGHQFVNHMFIVQAKIVTTTTTSTTTTTTTTTPTTSLPTTTSTEAPNIRGPLCLHCNYVISPDTCSHVIRCGTHEECYMEKVVDSLGNVMFNLGCQDSHKCTANSNTQVNPFGKRSSVDNETELEDGTQISLCKSCCKDRDLCNNGGLCGTSVFNYGGEKLCFHCDQQHKQDSCDRITLCAVNQQCFLHQKHSDTSYTVFWESGCTNSYQQCPGQNGPYCSNCCNTSLCNDVCTSSSTFPTSTPSSAKISTTTKSTHVSPGIDRIDIIPKHFHYGDDVKVECHVTGNPSHTGWNMLVDPHHTPTNVFIDNGNTLHITNFTKQNEGKYQCYAHNDVGDDKEIVTLAVQLPRPTKPKVERIDIIPAVFHYGDTVRMICHVTGYPKPNVGINIITDDPQHVPGNIRVQYESDGASVTITQYTDSNDATFQCYTQNNVGSDIRNVTLLAVK